MTGKDISHESPILHQRAETEMYCQANKQMQDLEIGWRGGRIQMAESFVRGWRACEDYVQAPAANATIEALSKAIEKMIAMAGAAEPLESCILVINHGKKTLAKLRGESAKGGLE